MLAFLTSTLLYNGFKATSASSVVTLHELPLVESPPAEDQSCCRPWLLVDIWEIHCSATYSLTLANGIVITYADKQIIAASPYLPMQYGYKDFVPSQSYYAFAQAAGCFDDLAQNNVSNSIFSCLVAKDTITLQNASAYISGSSRYGTWGFLPVTDGVFIQQLPSQQLLKKQVNGRHMLSGVFISTLTVQLDADALFNIE